MTLLGDLRYAYRSLRRSPGVVSFVVLTLAVGIAGFTAMFGLVEAVVLEPLPFQDSDELVQIWERRPLQGRERNPVSPADFYDWREQAAVFEDVAAHSQFGVNLTGDGEPERLQSANVSDGYLELFGVAPMLGRTFTNEEMTPGVDRVAILSHGLWTRRFASDPDVLSRTIRLDGVEHEVIGVMPAGFDFPYERDLWLPLAHEPEIARARGMHYLFVYARLADGRTLDEAKVEMTNLAARLEALYPENNTDHTTRVESLEDEILGDTRAGLWMLFGVSAFVLLICCANVANVWLARAGAREREVAVAVAMGAGWMRLIRPLLLEGAIVVAAAGAVGTFTAIVVAQPLVSSVMPGRVSSTSFEIVAFACVASGAALLLFGLYPALRVSSLGPEGALRTSRTVSSGGPKTLKKLLVVGEVALALMLVIASMLVVKSFERLSAVDPGFRTDGILAVRLSLPDATYPEPHQRSAFFDELLARVNELPGVDSAGSVSLLPLSGGEEGRFFDVEGRPPAPPGQPLAARVRSVSPGYFRTLGIPLVRGREVSPRDGGDAPGVIVVSQRLVDDYFPDEDPLGHRLSFGDEPFEIVGVVGDVRHTGLDVEPAPHAYFATAQRPSHYMTTVLRSGGDPLALAPAVREQVWAIDGDQPISSIDLFADLRTQSIAEPRKLKNAMTFFALVALVLAAGGVYGVMAYLVSQRSRDLAVRIALGARVRHIMGLVVTEAMSLVGVGVALALIAAALSSKLVARFLFEVEPFDAVAWAASVVILAAAAALATAVPARRCARIDPTESLRSE